MKTKKIYLASKAPCVNEVFAAFENKDDALEYIRYQQKNKPSVDLYLSDTSFILLSSKKFNKGENCK